jgi:hypothetical protein
MEPAPGSRETASASLSSFSCYGAMAGIRPASWPSWPIDVHKSVARMSAPAQPALGSAVA